MCVVLACCAQMHAYVHAYVHVLTLLKVAEVVRCTSPGHLRDFFDNIVREGGEGVVLRKAESRYKIGRSPNMLKVKVLPVLCEY